MITSICLIFIVLRVTPSEFVAPLKHRLWQSWLTVGLLGVAIWHNDIRTLTNFNGALFLVTLLGVMAFKPSMYSVPQKHQRPTANTFSTSMIVFFIILGLIAAMVPLQVKAQTAAQTNAQVKLLTSRMSDQITQLNKVTGELAATRLQVSAMTTEAESVRVWLIDFRCKWNTLLLSLSDKEALKLLANANPPIGIIRDKNCALDGPAPLLNQLEIPMWPVQPTP